jgi:poly-gamma-glutamate capsule biosynthesis protein CapA/YwtB (metallophosphatase superfamily)
MPAVRRLSTPAFFLLLALAVVPLVGLAVVGGSSATPSTGPASAVASAGLASGSGSPEVSSSASAPPSPAPGDSTGPVPSTPPGALADVPVVPVVDFRSTRLSVTVLDVKKILAGTHPTYHALELVAADADPILAALGVARPATASRLITVAKPATLAADLAADSGRLAFLRAAQVGPVVRAIAWGDRSLFGVRRVTKLSSWVLNARLPKDPHAFDAGRTWTLVAGGDILLDRGVAKQVKVLGKGVDFPWNGGTAEITGRVCCSSFDWPIPRTRRTGHAGAVRSLISGADLAVANFENPAPDAFRYHTEGTVFSADPKLIDGVRRAGIDYVSIANNHIGDAGAVGILQTIANLDARGIAHSGAGRNLAAARRPAMLSVRGLKVAILGYDTIARGYAAGPSKPGSAQLSAAAVRADVAAARRAGADLVIVYPHWGTEYRASPFAAQQALAHAVIDAGADLVIGNHAHWVGAMEIYKGHPIWYALGNFVFDQIWSEPTQEGMLLELTFRGAALVQVRLHPTIILDQAQPNFLDPAGDGRVVLGQLYDASKKFLPW